MCPMLASRLLAKGSLCKLPLPGKNCLCVLLPCFPPPDSYPLWDHKPFPRGGVPSLPLTQVASTRAPTTTDYTPYQALFCPSRSVPGVRLTTLPPIPHPAKGVGDGHTSAPESPAELQPLRFTRLLVSPGSLGFRVRGRVGVNGAPGGGLEGTPDRERDRVGSRHSLKPPLLPLLPSPEEGRGCRGRASRALGNSPRPPPRHSLLERLPQELELRALPHPPPAAAAASG